MKLRQLLNEIDRKATTALISKYFYECLNKYFSEYKKYDWEVPNFKLRAGTRNAGEFSYIPTKSKPMEPTLTINPDFAIDDFLRPIVFHETIHFVQANLSGMKLEPYNEIRYEKRDHHDSFFKKMMNEMNSKEGSDYITITQDATKLTNAHKSFFVYGFENNLGQFAYVWSPKENAGIDNWLNAVGKQKHKNIFKFETNDYYFKTKNSQAKPATLRFGIIEEPSKIEMVKKHFI